jgi:general secretion pathway protein C
MIMCATMVSRILALLVWACAAASVAYWGLRWFAKPVAVPPGTGSVAMSTPPHGDITRLLTGPAVKADEPDPNAQSALAARIQLLGVVAPRNEHDTSGVALLVVDGKPSRAFQAGQTIDGELIVQSIGQQIVKIGPRGGEALLTLNLSLLPAAATGSLPPPATVGGGPAAPAPVNSSPAAQNQAAEAGTGMAAAPIEGAAPADQANSQVPPGARRLPPRLRRRGMVGGPPGGQNTDGVEQQQPTM